MNDPDNQVEARSKPPPASWLSSHPLFRRSLYTLAGIVVVVALFYAEEDLRGKWTWEKYKREAEAKGEKFDLTLLAPPPVPDDQNFAMTPLLRPAFEYVRGTNGVLWRDTNGYAHLLKINFGTPPSDGTGRSPELGSLEKNSFTDLNAWQDFFLGNTNYPHSTNSRTAAESILIALEKFDPDLQEVATAAATRPYSRFPVEYNFEMPSAILLPHLAFIKAISTALALHAVAGLESGRSNQATTDLKLGFHLYDSIRDEPILIDHLVGIAILGIDLQVLREGLIRHAWSDAQLAEFERYLSSVNLLAEYKRAMRGERAIGIGDMDWLRRQGFKSQITPGIFNSDSSSSDSTTAFNFMPSGWYYQNMVSISEMHDEFTLPAADENARRVFPDAADGRENTLARKRTTPYNIFAKMMLPALVKAVRRSARMQTFVDEARVACALERYRLANGQLPETLDLLAPQFIDKIPNDLLDGQPLRYRRNPNGGYLIYSIGWNQTDDDGEIVWRKGATPSLDIDKGDWVWSMPGK